MNIGLDEALFKKIKQAIDEWIISESTIKYIRHEYPPIFDDLLCVSADDGRLNIDLLEKENLTLTEIAKLHDHYSSNRFAIFVSFVPLFKKPENLGPRRGYKLDDFIFGFILYEIVSRKILSLSIDPCSQLPFGDSVSVDRALVSSYGRTLLNSFAIHPPYFHSCCVLPTTSPNYTPILWLMYTLLDPRFDEEIRKRYAEKAPSVTEFFTFGVAPDLREGLQSFFYDRRRQTAFVYLRIRENDEKRAYELRFDYHSCAKLHVDFEVHMTDPDKKVKKLLKHQEIDLTKVDRIDPTLSVSMLFTGMHDPYFDRIVDQHIAGLEEIVKDNPF